MTSLLQRMDAQCISLTQRFLGGLGFGSWTASRDKARPDQSLKHFAAALLFGLGAASGHAATVLASSQPGSCIWHADTNGLHQVQADTNAVAQSISLKNIATIAMNGSDCAVWVVTGKQLYKYDRNAAQALQVALSSLDAKLNGAQLLAVDAYDDSVWLAHGKALFHIGANGQLVGSSTVPGSIETITVALDRSVWVLGNKQLWQYSAQGVLLSSQDLHDSVNAKPKLLAIDTLGGILWLAGEKQLTRLDLNQSSQPVLRIDLPHQVSAVALNPLRGELWLATANDQLLAYGRDGGALYTVNLQANNLRDVGNLAFDPVAQSLWTASRQALGRFSAAGEFIASLSGRDGSVALAAPAFMSAPAIALVRPPQNALTNNAQPTIAYRYDALCNGQPCTFTQDYFSGYSLSATLNQNPIGPFAFDAATGQASYAPASRLPEGQNNLSAQARDGFGNLSNIANDQFTIDTIPPSFLSVTPATGSVLTAPQATIQGAIDDINATVVLEGVGAATNTGISGSSLNFSFTVALSPGLNAFTLSAIDKAGNAAASILQLTFTPPPPSTPLAANISVSKLANGTVTVTGNAGAVGAGLRVAVTNTRTQQTINVNADGAGSFSATVAAQTGDAIAVGAVNQWGGTSPTVQFNVISLTTIPIDPNSSPGVVPPDPVRLAPPVDPTVPTNIATGTAFLYTGSDAIQTGVAPGTIETGRVAVVRGKVMDREGNALSAVRIRVLGHPEFGQTHSREDGMFDIAVNGGGYLTLDYTKTNYLPVQRTVKVPWQDFAKADDVSMTLLDVQVTTIDLSSGKPIQIARGSIVNDQDGARQATLLFQEGTTATMVLANGTTQSLTSLAVRATEYTVGPNGPKAMPGSLPTVSAYTYAVELSIDEAISAGAKSVQFNRPVYQYVENFLNMPVGGIVPAGYYDRQKAAWIPSDNGRVIKVLYVDGGIAAVDTNGDEQVDDLARLATLNITENELIQLAAIYLPGTSLWRVPIQHFTPWDYNWPHGPPDNAKGPEVPDAGRPSQEEKTDCKAGSIIECQNQSLGGSVSITGTKFSLNYKSNRTSGFDSRSIPIPLSGNILPLEVKRIDLVILVGGKEFKSSFPATPNQNFTFVWDGLDAYGRPLVGEQTARLRIGYVYDAYYRVPGDFPRSFLNFGDGQIRYGRAPDATLWKESAVRVGSLQSSTSGIGGWTLNVQHAYDHIGQVLHLGDGSRRNTQRINGITTVAGGGSGLDSGIQATAASLNFPRGMAIDAEGNLYFADTSWHRIRKVASDGIITTVAGVTVGNASQGQMLGDGGPATEAQFLNPYTVAIDSHGNLYVADTGNRRIRKITPDGIITTIAGKGREFGFSGDGGLATEAGLDSPQGLAVDAQGTLYILDNKRVRKLTPDGVIVTVAGNGNVGFPSVSESGDGGLATAALLAPTALTIDGQGNLYIAESSGVYRVRKVRPDGIITTVAGNGKRGFSGDGGPATEALLRNADGLAIDSQGTLYISDGNNFRVRKVTADGIIATVTGNGTFGFSGDGGPPAAASISLPLALAVDARDNLYFIDYSNRRIRKVPFYSPAISAGDIVIASENGEQIFQFDSAGRHLRTRSSTTGAEQYRFTYDANGYITHVIDGDGNLTHIERDSNSGVTAIVAPDGQRTVLALDTNGYLASITNLAGETTSMTYGIGGLLTRFTNPRNQTSTITYDGAGRLIKDQNAIDGFWDIAHDKISSDAYEVTMATALGRANRYKVERLATGDTRRTNAQPDGSVAVVLQKTDGTTQTTSVDGTVTTSVNGPDPRFGMQAPIVKSVVVKTPSGLTGTITRTRQAALSNSADLLSLVSETDTISVNGKVFKTVYNAAQRQYTVTTPLNRQTVVKTDVQGRPITEQMSGILPVNYAYDSRGRFISASQGSGAEERTVRYAYNPEGHVDSATDALNRVTRYTYDPIGRVKTVILPDGRIIGFSYDANGNVTSVTPPSRPAHGFDYNAVDLATDYTPPALGSQPVATRYDYNLDKDLVKITRPDGKTIDYAYDAGGRLATMTTPTGVANYGYKADSGQLASVTAPGDIGLAYSYDGALLTATSFTGPVAGSIRNTYDNFFRVSQLGVNGSNIAFGYDNDGLLTSAGSLALTRNAGNGLVTGSTLGQITTTQNYDSFGQLIRFTAKQGASVLYDEQYMRDKVGRLIQKTVTIGGETQLYGYSYDAVGRLTDVTRDGASIGHFEYDANGNRTLAYGIGAVYDEQDRLTSFGGAQYSYTANGELKQIVAGSSVAEYEYDVFGNLTHVVLPNGSTLDYLVDGRNRRIGKKVNGTLTQGFLYQDQLKPAAELNAQGGVVSRFVYAGKANVPEYLVKGGVTYRIVTDHLGSVRLVVDSATGQVAQRIDYDDWGNVQSDSNPGFQPFGFAGGLYDQHTQLVRFGARDYDPKTARWTAKDPIEFKGGDTGLYNYVGGDPVNLIDPRGLDPAGQAIGGAIGAWGGRVVGGAVGTAAGPVGTAVGGYTGGVVGGQIGRAIGNAIGDWIKGASGTKTPNRGDPGSVCVNPGSGQERGYGSDGLPDWDVDWDHDHGQGVPHGHEWGRGPNGEPVRGSGQPIYGPWQPK